jgi:hypothetical protein
VCPSRLPDLRTSHGFRIVTTSITATSSLAASSGYSAASGRRDVSRYPRRSYHSRTRDRWGCIGWDSSTSSCIAPRPAAAASSSTKRTSASRTLGRAPQDRRRAHRTNRSGHPARMRGPSPRRLPLGERDGRLTARYRRTDVVDVGPLDLGREESDLRVRIRSVHDVGNSGRERQVLGDIRLQPSDDNQAPKLREHSRQRRLESQCSQELNRARTSHENALAHLSGAGAYATLTPEGPTGVGAGTSPPTRRNPNTRTDVPDRPPRGHRTPVLLIGVDRGPSTPSYKGRIPRAASSYHRSLLVRGGSVRALRSRVTVAAACCGAWSRRTPRSPSELLETEVEVAVLHRQQKVLQRQLARPATSAARDRLFKARRWLRVSSPSTSRRVG